MLRFIGIAERNVQFDPPRVVTVAANVSTEIYPDETLTKGEIAQRYLQNVGANGLWYSFGVKDANGVPYCNEPNEIYHGYLASGQQLDCTHRKSVAVWSTAGTSVSTTVGRRHDTGASQPV